MVVSLPPLPHKWKNNQNIDCGQYNMEEEEEKEEEEDEEEEEEEEEGLILI